MAGSLSFILISLLLSLLTVSCSEKRQYDPCNEFPTCASCVTDSSCGWCSESRTCQGTQGNCTQYNKIACELECGKFDFSCGACLAQYANSTCGWCHGKTQTLAGGNPGQIPTHVGCLNTQPGTNQPNNGYSCETWITPALNMSCPGCDSITNCENCTANSMCGICMPISNPAGWECQEGEQGYSYELCRAAPLVPDPSEVWAYETCAPLCETYGTCSYCTKHPECSWCVTNSTDSIGECLPAGGNQTCEATYNTTAQCSGGSTTPCGNRVTCSECASNVPGTTYDCGWCETSTVFQCYNATQEADKCPNSPDWYTDPSSCPAHCPGYPVSECSGHGLCNGTQCACNSTYFGLVCNQYCTDAGTCNGNGYCFLDPVTDLVGCSCKAGYYGEACEVYCVANETCNGNGVCNPESGACDCQGGWNPPSCGTPRCEDYTWCATCLQNVGVPNACVWCETMNTCMNASANPATCQPSGDLIEQIHKCSASCTVNSYSSCTNGDHCGCYWCYDFNTCWSTEGNKYGTVCDSSKYHCSESKLEPGTVAVIVILSIGGAFLLLLGAWVGVRKFTGKPVIPPSLAAKFKSGSEETRPLRSADGKDAPFQNEL